MICLVEGQNSRVFECRDQKQIATVKLCKLYSLPYRDHKYEWVAMNAGPYTTRSLYGCARSKT